MRGVGLVISMGMLKYGFFFEVINEKLIILGLLIFIKRFIDRDRNENKNN